MQAVAEVENGHNHAPLSGELDVGPGLELTLVCRAA